MADEPNIKGHRYYAKENHIKLLKTHLTKALILADAIDLIDGTGSSGTAPTITATPLLTDNAIDVAGDLPMTFHYTNTASATPPSNAVIKAAPDSRSLSAGANSLTGLTQETDPGTWYFHYLVSNAAGDSAVQTESYVISAAFDPADIPEAILVWDASDISTLWQNTDGTGAVTATGQPVGSMNNRGSLGGRFANSGGSARPTYTESGGLKYLATSTDDFIRWLGSNGDIDLTGGFYMCIGAEEVGDSTFTAFAAMASTSGNSYNDANGVVIDAHTSGNGLIVWCGADNAAGLFFQDASVGTLAKAVVELEVTPATGATNGTLRIRRVADGDVVVINTDAATSGNFPNNATNVAQLNLGSRIVSGSPSNFNSGRIYCGVVITGAVSSGDRADCRLWVAERLGF
jgi:hypothetical protein